MNRCNNIGEVIDAFAVAAHERPEARIVLAHGGSLTEDLRAQAERLGIGATFTGHLERAAFRDALADAELFVPRRRGTRRLWLCCRRWARVRSDRKRPAIAAGVDRGWRERLSGAGHDVSALSAAIVRRSMTGRCGAGPSGT